MKSTEKLHVCANSGTICSPNFPARLKKTFITQLGYGGTGLIIWSTIYSQLQFLSHYLTYDLLGYAQGSRLGESICFFAYNTPKLLMVLALVTFLTGIMRSYITPARIREFLAGRQSLTGVFISALFGVTAPFSSCSIVPVFIGFVQAGIPLSFCLSFLAAGPMVNETVVVALFSLFGWKVAALYFCMGLSIAFGVGWLVGFLDLEHSFKDWMLEIRLDEQLVQEKIHSWQDRMHMGMAAMKNIVGRVWFFVVAGIAVCAVICGYFPQDIPVMVTSGIEWWSIPLTILASLPLYSDVTSVTSVIQTLLNQGATREIVLIFMMSILVMSVPEYIMLRAVLKAKLLKLYAVLVGSGILLCGFLFSLIV